jgi:regulator of extracellular matrix RemA (YlzA/DUF370 family)
MQNIFLNIGHGNSVSSAQVVAILNPASAPAIRLRTDAKKSARLLNATQGHKTRALIVTASGHVIESALEVPDLTTRFNRTLAARGGAFGQISRDGRDMTPGAEGQDGDPDGAGEAGEGAGD